MIRILKVLIFIALSVSSFAQSQGVSMRATNGVAFGEMIVQSHVQATNTASTNTFAGKFQQGIGSFATGSGASAFGLGTRSAGGYSFASGISNQVTGNDSFASGRGNTITSDAQHAFANGINNSVLDPSSFVNGAGSTAAGSNSFASGLSVVMTGLSPNSFVAGQNITVDSGSSNNFAWNGDPSVSLNLPASRSNSFTVSAPGGIFFNGVQFTNGGTGSTYTNNTTGTPGTITGLGISTNPVIVPPVVALTYSGTNVTLNASLGNHFSLTCTTNTYFIQPSSLTAMQELIIDVRMNGTGGWSVNFDTNYWKFPSGQVLTTTTNASAWSEISAVVGQFATNVAVIQSLNFQ